MVLTVLLGSEEKDSSSLGFSLVVSVEDDSDVMLSSMEDETKVVPGLTVISVSGVVSGDLMVNMWTVVFDWLGVASLVVTCSVEAS